MPRRISYTAGEAAKALGVSLDTLRRWDRDGRIVASRDRNNRRVITAGEIDRLRGGPSGLVLSARNRLQGTVTSVRVEGLMAQVEIAVEEPARLVALVTRDAVEDIGLKEGMGATAVIKSTSVMVQR